MTWKPALFCEVCGAVLYHSKFDKDKVICRDCNLVYDRTELLLLYNTTESVGRTE